MANLASKITKKQWHSGKVGSWLYSKSFLIRLHSQAHSDFLPQHHVELTNLSFTKPQAFSDLETSSPGDGLSGNKSSTIPGDLVTQVAINRDVKIMGDPMRGGHSASINAENDFIRNSHMLAKLKKRIVKQNEFKNRLKPQRINTERN